MDQFMTPEFLAKVEGSVNIPQEIRTKLGNFRSHLGNMPACTIKDRMQILLDVSSDALTLGAMILLYKHITLGGAQEFNRTGILSMLIGTLQEVMDPSEINQLLSNNQDYMKTFIDYLEFFGLVIGNSPNMFSAPAATVSN